MPEPHTPSDIDSLGDRPFSFYPAIVNIEHNEWHYRRATWSETLVTNTATGEDLWIPRRYVGEVSRADEPVVIVGLVKELEYKAGAVWPYQRRVVAMPMAVGGGIPVPGTKPARMPMPRGRAPAAEQRVFRLIGFALVVALAGYLVMANLFREGVVRPRLTYTTKDQSYLELTSRDDILAVSQRLGTPGRDRWLSESGEIQYRALSYPQRAYTVILMGSDRNSATYIGVLDDNWKPVHAIQLSGGGNTFALLRRLPRF